MGATGDLISRVCVYEVDGVGVVEMGEVEFGRHAIASSNCDSGETKGEDNGR